MSRKKIISLFVTLILSLSALFAQNVSEIRINEILVINTADAISDFGERSSWIELFNASYGTVDIAGCYLTNDPGNLTKYMIPKGDLSTKVKPRQHTLFWADGKPKRGTYHISFTLKDSEEILFVAGDGKTIIDRVKIPHEILEENISYGRFRDGLDLFISKKKEIDISKTWGLMECTTPGSNNYGADVEPAGVIFKRADPYGVVMSTTAMSVVFLSLIVLYIMFKYIGNYNIRISRKNAELASAKCKKIVISEEETSAEVFAAITAALHAYFEDEEAHDFEHTILTIDKVTRNYSPWSSKIYTLRETPKLKKN